jgi:hypothetical protein
LVEDEEARWWCTTALAEVVRGPDDWRLFAPNPWLAAFKTFAELASVASVDEAASFLEFSRPLVPRDPNTYRHTDEAMVEATIVIGLTKPSLRPLALELLLECLLTDQRMADLILGGGGELLRGYSTEVAEKLGTAALAGNFNAALAIAQAGGAVDAAIPEARRRLEDALRPTERAPGVFSFGTILPRIALLVRVLPTADRVRFAEGMLRRATGTDDIGQNRADALTALRVIGPGLPDAVRDEMYRSVVPFATGDYEPGVEPPTFEGADDPLSRFRFSLGTGDLKAPGLMALAALARTGEQSQEIEGLVFDHLRTEAIPPEAAVRALLDIPDDAVGMPVAVLSAHSTPAMRALGAVLWARRMNEPEDVGVTLARDRAKVVRASLASALNDDPRHEVVRAILARDPRRSVRRRAQRGAS